MYQITRDMKLYTLSKMLMMHEQQQMIGTKMFTVKFSSILEPLKLDQKQLWFPNPVLQLSLFIISCWCWL